MAMNSLRKLVHVLESGVNEIRVDPKILARAKLPIERLLDFAAARKQVVYGANDT
ncbi:quinolinate synthetase [compost metagenome]